MNPIKAIISAFRNYGNLNGRGWSRMVADGRGWSRMVAPASLNTGGFSCFSWCSWCHLRGQPGLEPCTAGGLGRIPGRDGSATMVGNRPPHARRRQVGPLGHPGVLTPHGRAATDPFAHAAGHPWPQPLWP